MIQQNQVRDVILQNHMAKRGTTLSPKKKSRRSHKTAKRLVVKRAMLAKKALRGKFKNNK
jgi:hypothetical protein